jgi:hypothetical protein
MVSQQQFIKYPGLSIVPWWYCSYLGIPAGM